MTDHKLVVFSEHRGEDETQSDENGSHNEQNARAISVEDLANNCRKKELNEGVRHLTSGTDHQGSKYRTHRKEELDRPYPTDRLSGVIVKLVFSILS